MESSGNDAVATGVSIVVMLFAFLIAVGLYIFTCYCFKRICEKCGRNPGVLIWIPIVQLVPLLELAGMAVWMIILFLIPIVNIVVGVMMWAKICQARGKSPWLVIMVFIPFVNIFFVPYLAFSE
jgi:uncharacterized membrane protein YhaH (DUF805 family)